MYPTQEQQDALLEKIANIITTHELSIMEALDVLRCIHQTMLVDEPQT